MLDELIAGFDGSLFCKFLNAKFAGSFSAARQGILFKKEFGWEKAERLGVVKTLAGPSGANMPLLVVAVKLPDGETLKERSSRLRQFKFAKQVLDQAMSDPHPGVEGVLTQGLFVFYDAEGNFRLSLVYGKAEGTKLVWSTAKRLSFHVQAGEGNKTFRDRMDLPWGSFDKLKEAFSVEKLTKEFYNRLFDWYQWALSPEMNVTYPNDTSKTDDDRQINEHIIRLITRLMFVWFLKQKHLVPDNLFDPASLKKLLKSFSPTTGDNFYRVILQNLFFATLNSEISERAFAVDAGNIPDNKEHFGIKTLYRYGGEFSGSEKEVLKLFSAIPFLNGGLFECLDKDKDYYDGFSRNSRKQARIPNRLFFDEAKGLIPLLQQYNFTVEENSPGDEEVALDPELLGKVFENLLGAYNPETNVAARNATGSFYTPREIVNYMVDESLIAHLTGKCGEEHADVIRKLFTDSERPADKSLCKKLDEALVTAKILDPACGSGAFPMGVLLRMVELLRILRNIPEDQSVHDLKLGLIENCIYGGDIQCIAVQISKLRFFISLVCEQKPTNDAEKNYGINPLPNLETKFVAADSLIGLPRDGTELPIANVEKLKIELWAVRHKHFIARSHREKKELRKEDKRLRTALANALEEAGGFDTTSARLMVAWDPYDQNASAPFSDPEWMFNVKDGFDIVIGNPPYFNLNTVDKELVGYLKIKYSEIHTGYNDIVYYFLCLGLRLLSSSGIASFITSNYYLGNDYAQKLRILLAPHLTKLINFKDYQVFSEASVHTCIAFLHSQPINNLVHFLEANEDRLNPGGNVEDFMRRIYIQREELKANWVVANTLEKGIFSKIHKESILLGDISEIAKGPETGNNTVYSLTKDEVDRLCIETEVVHPFIKNSQITKYAINWHGEYMLYADSTLNKKTHPNAFAYLESFKKTLSQRRGPRYNEYEWWRLHRPSMKHVFDAPEKIVVPYRAACNRFAYDNSQYFNDGGDIRAIVLKNSAFSYKYVLGLLNSRLLDWFYGFIGKPKGNSREYFNKPLALIPIKKATNIGIVSKIESLVNRILGIKKTNPSADTTKLEYEIDELVYDLYGLTQEEKEIVKASVSRGGSSDRSDDSSVFGGGDATEDAEQRAGSGVSKAADSEPKTKKVSKKRKPQLPPSLPGWD